MYKIFLGFQNNPCKFLSVNLILLILLQNHYYTVMFTAGLSSPLPISSHLRQVSGHFHILVICLHSLFFTQNQCTNILTTIKLSMSRKDAQRIGRRCTIVRQFVKSEYSGGETKRFVSNVFWCMIVCTGFCSNMLPSRVL